MKKIRLCIVIPAYNESAVISSVIESTNDVFNGSKYDHTILVVDDCSIDGTVQEVLKSKSTRCVQHIVNQGAGGATSTGLRYALLHNFDMAVTMDADGQHSPEDVKKCIEALITSDVDLLIGSRLIDKKGMSRVKVLGNRGLSFITWLLFGVNVTDSQSGLRVFSNTALKTLEWKSTGYDFCSEMIWRANRAGLKIKEHPIKAIYTDYSVSKGQNNWNGVNIVKSLVRRRIVELFE